jgi:hypothetical protein
MKLTVSEDNELMITECFSGVLLRTRDGEEIGICMRDSGFEFTYQGEWYSAQKGEIKKLKTSIRGNVLVDQHPDNDGGCNSGCGE